MNPEEVNLDARDRLKKAILDKVIITSNDHRIAYGDGRELSWIMDFRKIILNPTSLFDIANLFFEIIKKNYPNKKIQIGGLETAAIPIISSLVSLSRGEIISNGFFIRKSRKKTGLLNLIEGILEDEEVVLVDDILSYGRSALRQIEILESLDKKITGYITIVRFRDLSFYEELNKRGIRIFSIFDLQEFSYLGLKVTDDIKIGKSIKELNRKWYFKSPGAKHEFVIPKSSPFLYKELMFFGSDNGTFWALNKNTGEVQWQRKVVYGGMGKRIFSSPVVAKDTVFFGGYDGNFYALDAQTGKVKWVAMDADWIGSSPCVSEDLGIVFVGMEYGLPGQRGGVNAYDIETGKMIWSHISADYTHCSPVYSHKYKTVICGSNDGTVTCFDAKTGHVIWVYLAQGEIKASCSLSPSENMVAFGTFNQEFVILNTRTGKLINKLTTDEVNYSTPTWANENELLCSSLDKCLYCFNVDKGCLSWKVDTSGRIFSQPVINGGDIYVGNNAGQLYILNSKTGEKIEYYQLVERITNKVLFDTNANTIYIPTNANEIFALELPESIDGESIK